MVESAAYDRLIWMENKTPLFHAQKVLVKHEVY